jgi:hypothetical protein
MELYKTMQEDVNNDIFLTPVMDEASLRCKHNNMPIHLPILKTTLLSASFHTSHDFRENSVIISVRILFYLDKLWKLLVMEWLKYFEAAP